MKMQRRISEWGMLTQFEQSNILYRLQISDGVSYILAMINNFIYEKMVRILVYILYRQKKSNSIQ